MTFLLYVGLLMASPAQDDVADVPSQERRVGDDEKKKYFEVGPAKDAAPPKDGFGLVVVMPGGSGDAQFLPFVKRLFRNALPAGCIVAQPVAVKWTAAQRIIWPTAKDQVAGAKFTTEQFVDAVVKDVESRRKLDPKRIFTLSWSSSGPAAYAISLTSKRVVGSFVAMSVFRPASLPKLDAAKGHAYYIYHSEEDRVCPFRMAKQAQSDLTKAGAKVEFATYDGGHGWRGPLFDDVRTGVEWLEKNAAAGEKK